MTKTAILYARVSTEDQAEHGYSLRQQIEALRKYADVNGYEVIDVIEDAGYSGAAFDRPGLNRIRERVAEGGVDVVLAQERDRISREPAYHYLLKKEFEAHGTALRALNDSGDDSPVGQLTDGILDQIAKFQRAHFALKSRQNKEKKAREGKTSGSGAPPYGYAYDADRTNYVVDPEAMAVIRELFRMVGVEGMTLHTAKKAFEAAGVLSPGGKRFWQTPSMRRTINNDAYLAHSFADLRMLVESGNMAAEVLAGCDPGKLYGVWWYGMNRVTLTPDADKRRRFDRKPRSQWVAIPIPDAGIPRQWVEAARAQQVKRYRPRKPNSRFNELRGIVRCACGASLAPWYTRDENGRWDYYTCLNRRKHGREGCPAQGAQWRAVNIEGAVAQYVSDLLRNPRKVKAQLDAAIAAEERKLRNPQGSAKMLASIIAEADQERAGYIRLAARGQISDAELDVFLTEAGDRKAAAESELADLLDGQRRVDELRAAKRAILEAYGKGLLEGIEWFPPELRRQIYDVLNVKVTALNNETLRVDLNVDANVIRYSRDLEDYARRRQEWERRWSSNPPAFDELAAQLDAAREGFKAPPEDGALVFDLPGPVLSDYGTDTVMAEVAG
jgi:site-specific DNA recombinase